MWLPKYIFGGTWFFYRDGKLNIGVAVGPLACEPPNWLRAGIIADDNSVIESAINPRRKRELLWSRGLKAGLMTRMPERGANGSSHDACPPPRVSIAHDRHFAAVAISQYGNIGVDLQTDCSLETCCRIAEAWFPCQESGEISEEILALRSCERFLLSWVIKEAWAKCMNRSIFETCRSIGIWQGRVHISGDTLDSPQFAWSRQYFDIDRLRSTGLRPDRLGATTSGFGTGVSMGMCLKGNMPDSPNIEYLLPGPNSALHGFVADWKWIPVAGQDRRK